jgi:hypothetical protein
MRSHHTHEERSPFGFGHRELVRSKMIRWRENAGELMYLLEEVGGR